MTRAGYVYRRCVADGRKVPTDQKRCSRCGGDRFVWGFKCDVAERGAPRQQKARSGFTTKAEALAAMAKLQQQAADPTHVEPSKLSVGAYLDQWLAAIRADPKIRPATWRSYELAVRRYLKPRVGSVPLRHLTRVQVKAAYADLNGTGLSPKTVHNAHITLRRALRDAVDDRLIPANPAERAHAMPQRTVEMRTWDGPQVGTFLRSVAGDPLAALWRLLVATGMRRGEALALRRQDLDLGDGWASVSRQRVRGHQGWTYGEPKTSSGRRRVDLDPTTVAALRAHLSDQVVVGTEGLVFARGDGSPVDPDVVSQRFDTLSRAAGMPRIRLHDLRHTHASLALAAGVPAKVVQERLGHASVEITLNLYSHVAPTMQRDAAAAVARLIDG